MNKEENTVLVAGVTAAIVSLIVVRRTNRKHKTLEYRNAKNLKACKKAQVKLEKMMTEYKKNYVK